MGHFIDTRITDYTDMSVDAIQEAKTNVFIHDLCKSQDGRLACCVLVERAPGVRKTTYLGRCIKNMYV